MSRPPIIIIGAARSGTKLLRALVASSNAYKEVPHDVNYIWRYGSERHSHDELTTAAATPRMKNFVRNQLSKMSSNRSKNTNHSFVEKTVSNTLRLPLVNAVLPEAKYIHLVRNGYAVTESSIRCWKEPTDHRRILDKLGSFPWKSCARYAFWYASGYVAKKLSKKNKHSIWGPRYQGIQEDLQRLSLPEVCAWQWRHSVEHVLDNKAIIPNDRWLDLSYQQLIDDPVEVASRVGQFLGIEEPDSIINFANKRVNRNGKTAADTMFHQPALLGSPVHAIVGPTNKRLSSVKSSKPFAA